MRKERIIFGIKNRENNNQPEINNIEKKIILDKLSNSYKFLFTLMKFS